MIDKAATLGLKAIQEALFALQDLLLKPTLIVYEAFRDLL